MVRWKFLDLLFCCIHGTYILVIDGDIMHPGQGEDRHVVLAGQIEFGRRGVLVGNDTISYRQKLLDSLPSLTRHVPIVARPDRDPGKEVSYHSTKPTAQEEAF